MYLMESNGDAIDLYTLWKQNEQLSQQQLSPTLTPNAIPFKSNASKFLVPTIGQVFYTDGYSSMKLDDYYERTLFDEEMEVPSIGTDKKNFDTAEMVTFDISGSSTRLPLMCKMIIYQQGATHEREPPLLVRDVCIQWDGTDPPCRFSFDYLSAIKKSKNGPVLERARSSDNLLDQTDKSVFKRFFNEPNRCISMGSSMNEDDDTSSIMTAGGTIHHRVSHLLHRHRYLHQIDPNLLGLYEFYSVPFYQYRGRRYGQKHVAIQMNETNLNTSLNPIENSKPPTLYSVTIILSVRDRHNITDAYLNSSKLLHISIPSNDRLKHTTIAYINTREYITIQRTIRGQVVNA